jgi:Zn-dependent M28 family amino/carboxypeptidase
MVKIPGRTYSGPLPPLTVEQTSIREECVCDVEKLAGEIGERNIWSYLNLVAAADFIEASLTCVDYKVNRQNFYVEGKTCSNIETEISVTESDKEIVVIGAHYDTVFDSPGADDNSSGVAAVLALARRFAGQRHARTLRFVLFANEEPPFFQTKDMGSLIYAKSCRKRNDNIVAMLCLESIGYYSEQPNSQKYPFPYNYMYPSTGNFIGFVSNVSSRKLLHTVIASFRRNCKFPSQGGVAPGLVPGVAWSDHWSFWQQGYPAVMITDTAPFRYPYYHGPEDTADRICYDHLTRVISGLMTTIAELIGLVTSS